MADSKSEIALEGLLGSGLGRHVQEMKRNQDVSLEFRYPFGCGAIGANGYEGDLLVSQGELSSALKFSMPHSSYTDLRDFREGTELSLVFHVV